MKKILILSVSLLMLFSCNKKENESFDEGVYNPDKKISVTQNGDTKTIWTWENNLLKSVTNSTETKKFEYDDRNRVLKIETIKNGSISSIENWEYTGGEISKITETTHEENETNVFIYTFTRENGKITKINCEKNGESYYVSPLTWENENIKKRTYFYMNGNFAEDEYTYDNKVNPYYHCPNFSMGAEYLSKNNVLTWNMEIQQEKSSMTNIESDSYDYNGDYPITKKRKWVITLNILGTTSSTNGNSMLYFEYK